MTDQELARVAIELREGDGMRFSEIAQRLPRDRDWVEEACEDGEAMDNFRPDTE